VRESSFGNVGVGMVGPIQVLFGGDWSMLR